MSTVSYRGFTGNAAENYQRDFVPAIAEPVSGDLLAAADLQPGERVLDLACGTGLVARLAAERVGSGGSVTGIDVSDEMLEVARSLGGPTGVAIDWQLADAASLPLPDGSYDVALCQMGLMFVEDRLGALTELRRVLRPGGRVVLNTPGPIQPGFEEMEQALAQHLDPALGGFVSSVFSLHDPAEVAALLDGAGFGSVSSWTSVTTLRLPAPAEFLWQYVNLTPIAPLVAQADDAARAAVERQVVERWAPFVVDGSTVVHQPMVLATGTAPD